MVIDATFGMLVTDLTVDISLFDKPCRQVGWHQLRYRSVNGCDSWLKCDLIVKAHADCSIDVLETAGFLEPHASGKTHHNCLLRAADYFRWRVPAEQLFDQYQVRVNFGTNIRTWAEGCVYGRVASEHKPPDAIDQHPVPSSYHYLRGMHDFQDFGKMLEVHN